MTLEQYYCARVRDVCYDNTEEEFWAIQDYLSSYELTGADMLFLHCIHWHVFDFFEEDEKNIFLLAEELVRFRAVTAEKIDAIIKWLGEAESVLGIELLANTVREFPEETIKQIFKEV